MTLPGAAGVAELLAGIASTAPAPGSGAAGAVALALGVACARKALGITATHHQGDPALAAADARLAAIGAAALAGAAEDAVRFAAYLDAMRMPHGNDEEAGTRRAAMAAGAAALVELAGRLAALGGEAKRLLATLAGRIDAVMANDVIAARALIAAGCTIQSANAAESRRHLG